METAGIPYAVVGGNVVASWVSRIDEAAVRNTQDVDILLLRSDFEAAKIAMGAAGFIYRHTASIDMFLDGPGPKAREAVHIHFANERVRPGDSEPTADVVEFVYAKDGNYRHLTLEALVRMKLTSYRLKDQVHLQDLIAVGLIDETWPAKYQPILAGRLQAVLDNPDG